MKICIKLAAIVFCLTLSASAQTAKPSRSTVTRESGGTIQTPLNYNIILNKESSLMREWITVHDNGLPVKFSGTCGIKVIYEDSRTRGAYKYLSKFTIQPQEPIEAIEIRFLLFDIWGNHVKTLKQTMIESVVAPKELQAKWELYSENEAAEFYASIAYMSKVRLKSGRIIEGDTLTVLDEARKFSKKFSAEELEPKTEKK